jgi:hypothetical protein
MDVVIEVLVVGVDVLDALVVLALLVVLVVLDIKCDFLVVAIGVA